MKYEKEHYFLYCKKYENKLNWGHISDNPNITWEIIQNNPDKDWHWICISDNQMNN